MHTIEINQKKINKANIIEERHINGLYFPRPKIAFKDAYKSSNYKKYFIQNKPQFKIGVLA